MERVISLHELKHLIDTRGNCLLIDVREPHELKFGMIPAAKNIPLGEIERAMSLSPEAFKTKYHFPYPKKEEKIVVYCRAGGRSQAAQAILQSRGFINAVNFQGSIWEWFTIDPSVQRYGPAP